MTTNGMTAQTGTKKFAEIATMIAVMLGALLSAAATTGCEEFDGILGNEETPPDFRYLHFDWAEIPSDMSDETAMQLALDSRSNRIQAAAQRAMFPTDQTNLLTGSPTTYLSVYPAGTAGGPGSTRLFGGYDENGTAQGTPNFILIDASRVVSGGSSSTEGNWQLVIERGNNDLVLTGTSLREEMHFELTSYNQNTEYGTGEFRFIAKGNDNGVERRFIVFNGTFALVDRN